MKVIIKIVKSFLDKKISIRNLLIMASAIILLSIGFNGGKIFSKASVESKPELVNTRALESALVESGELTTAKLNLTCLSEYKDSGVILLNRADFMLVYDVTVRAGIDMKKVVIPADKIDYINKVIYISIPKAEIQSVYVNPATIRYLEQKLALINLNEKEDANKAQELAEDDATQKALDSGIIELADNQSEILIKGILLNVVPDGYTIEITKVIE
ncbi:hypothetical protein SDC9_77315 [bioreactor metagenome]|uniref:DUF4230 domain-containing protein n=1 Tax=bioreactor metagenome TaxID=1076179 RepID=A0A644YQ93_9ZZZZ